MTVPSGEVGITYGTGNGVADTFDYEFKITSQEDLKVTTTNTSGVDTVLTLTTDYTVTGVGDDGGGSITLVAGALTEQYVITIEDNVEISQLTPFGSQSAFDSSLHEDAIDKNTRIARKAFEETDRSLKIPASVQGVSTEIPKPASMRLLRWNAAANAIENVVASDITTASAYGNFEVDTYAGSGVDFTAGSTTQLTLSSDPGAEANTQVYFDGVYVSKTDYSISGAVITFAAPITSGTTEVEVVYGTALTQGAVTDADLVEYDNSTSGLTATDVKAAIDEVVALPSVPTPQSSKYGNLIVQNTADDDYELLNSQGTSGQVLTSGGADALPTWTTPSTAAVPTGVISIWATGTAPSGYLLCNGSAVSRTTYSTLFALIGVIYGNGDGSTTFNLPDFRGQFVRGTDNSAGVDPDAASRTDRGDATTGDAVGTKQGEATKAHLHASGTLTTSTTGNHAHTFPGQGSPGTGGEALNDGLPSGTITTSTAGNHSHTISGSTANSSGSETRPINIGMNFIIKT
jgi:microcystin-dependent protein